MEHWNSIFVWGSIVSVVGAAVFLIFGTAKRQDWAPDTHAVDDEEALIAPL